MPSCGPPKSVTVRGYWRAKARRKRSLKAGARYYVAENEQGRECTHKHRTFTGAHACAVAHNKAARRQSRRKEATYITDKRTVR